jgi:hypothetical protein
MVFELGEYFLFNIDFDGKDNMHDIPFKFDLTNTKLGRKHLLGIHMLAYIA